jgi:glycosyl transferase family 25
MMLSEYFDRIAVIHLPERRDRFRGLSAELRAIGLDITHPKVRIPHAPRPSQAYGFPSRGVYGNFLSHLEILRCALNDGLETIWVLEDDAIFSRRLQRQQDALVEDLRKLEWGICFLGHSLTRELRQLRRGLLPPPTDFIWAHCYAVHARALPRIVRYLESAVDRPEGHPEGGKLYIDGAFTLFRRFNPDVTALVSNPSLSVQRGSPSSLNRANWYDTFAWSRPIISAARRCRDQWWRLRA